VKVIKREETHCSFLIGKREREMLFSLLQRYPVMLGAHFKARNPPKTDEAKKNQDLLEEALAEQQKENRKQLEQMLAENGRFVENDLGYTFHLTYSEIEWLLQVLNDIKVGSWIQLGEPDLSSGTAPPLNEQTLLLAWAIDLAERFQRALLEATRAAEPAEPEPE
jgi:hypothetical protein